MVEINYRNNPRRVKNPANTYNIYDEKEVVKMGKKIKIAVLLIAFAKLVFLWVLGPTIAFGLGWAGGYVLKMCAGDAITNGLNLLFGTTRFTPEFIPLVCATLATIGRFFKSTPVSQED